MIKMRLHLLRIALVATATFTFTSHSQAGDACAEGFTLCAPRGATSERSPQIGSPAFERLFVGIVFSSLPPSSERSLVASSTSLCCHSTMSCLLMSNLEIPFCYDPFTTDYYLPDGSYGTVVDGAYNSSSGDLANLLSGQYTLVNGSTGNIYSNASTPNTATLPMPNQYTASGTGSAIPASVLGDEITITYTTTFSGTTIPPSTIPASTISATVTSATIILQSIVSTQVSGSWVASTSMFETPSAITISETTIPGSTIPVRTIEPLVTTITTTEIVAPKNTSPSATGGKKNTASEELQIPSFSAICLGFVLICLI